MKLWHKIFLCMFLLSITSVGIYGATMIHKNHLENLQREMDRSSNEMDLFSEAISKSARSLGSMEAAAAWYSNYYQSRNIYFSLYKDKEQTFCSLKGMPGDVYQSMLDISSGEKIMYVRELKNKNYFLTAKLLDPQTHTTLFTIRDISSLYQIRQQKRYEFVLWILSFSTVMALFSYLMSKLLVRPLNKLKTNTEQINSGIYQVYCPEGKDEIGTLGAAFNTMAKTVADREKALKTEAEQKQLLIDSMTHEMNTPLTSIQGYAQFLRNANCTKEQQDTALKNIETEARRMHIMYQKLRSLQLAGAEDIILEKIPLPEAVLQVCEELKPVLDQSQITIREYFQKPFLETDRLLLHLLLSNLIRNSINYSEKGSQIFVTYHEENAQNGILSVQDSGCGIPAQSLDKVMTPFYRVDKSRSRATGGSGIGLYLCNKIMEHLGGTLKIRSAEGKGTTVSLIFPKQ